MSNMNPPGDWSGVVGYGFLLAVVIVPPIAAVGAAAWLTRRLLAQSASTC